MSQIPILSIETSTDVCSVAIHLSGELKACAELNEKGVHSAKIMSLIEEVLRKASLQISDLKAVAVSEGPGSYTGLRIGVSTAKGLCFGLGIPLVAVNTLQGLAFQLNQADKQATIIALLDARRMEVYSQVFSAQGEILRELKAEVLDELIYAGYLDQGLVYFIGDGAGKASSLIQHQNAQFLENQVSANSVGEIAWLKYEKQEFEDLAYFVPNYLKEFKALHSKKNPLLA